mmetsp:Transcript_5396/g.7161  ORF Transcript_5396/g.7161 Transcript_5396/m.7161 type:complete len:280 (-) Transcript_5396:86-925(-)
MQVLSIKEYSDIIVWLPHGKAFAIISPRDFVSQVLPNYFKKAKYSSFTRKLHRWGFQRTQRGEEAGSYYHKLFQRDDEALCMKMSMKVTSRKSKESLKSTEAPLSRALGIKNDCVAYQPCFGQEISKNTLFDRVSHEALLSTVAKQPNITEDSICKQMQQNSSAIQVSPPTLLESAALAGTGADQMALEQMLISRRLQARYQASLYSRMLMNPLTHGVEQLIARQQRYIQSEILASAQISALSSNIVNHKPKALLRNQVGTGKNDTGVLSMLSMIPPSA